MSSGSADATPVLPAERTPAALRRTAAAATARCAGIARGAVYVANAVKHFRFQERGKRRIHQKPDAGQIRACRPWLRAEIDVIRPEALVLLGATVARALLGSGLRLMAERGRRDARYADDIARAGTSPHSCSRR
jgi:uracil-DNA glycosylase family 4